MRDSATRGRWVRPAPLFGWLSLLALLVFLALPARGVAQDAADEVSNADASSAQLVAQGKQLWTYKGCEGCHTIGDGRLSGPDLQGVTQRRQTEWLKRFMAETDEMLDTDPLAQRMLQLYNYQRMPQIDLRDGEIDALLAYIEQKSAR